MIDGLPATIDDVIAAFDEVLGWAVAKRSPVGYFPAVYRSVTCTVRSEIAAGHFDDGERMARFDVCFANRYLEAFRGWVGGREITQAWRVSFEAASDPDLTILQHLLLGVNAHMNLDLGCAASEVAPGSSLEALRPDFVRINTILDSLVDHDRLVVDGLSPRLRELDRVGKLSDHFVDLDIKARRQRSWSVAERLALLNGQERDAAIAVVDSAVVDQSRHVLRPELLVRVLFEEVRPAEKADPAEVITALLR